MWEMSENNTLWGLKSINIQCFLQASVQKS